MSFDTRLQIPAALLAAALAVTLPARLGAQTPPAAHAATVLAPFATLEEVTGAVPKVVASGCPEGS